MRVNEIMKRIVHTIQSGDTLQSAARHMFNDNVSLLPVVEEALVGKSRLREDLVASLGFLPVVEENVLVGVITTRDIVVRGIAQGRNPENTMVSEIMTQDLACCDEHDDVSTALEIMERRKVRRLFALNREQQIVGLISRHDIWAAMAGAFQSTRGESKPRDR
jgi:CBS domain-containing protein